MTWDQIIHTGVEVAAVIVSIWIYRRGDRKERAEIREKAKRDEDDKHAQNKAAIQDLKDGQKTINGKIESYGLHVHTERVGQLTVDGIFPRRD